MIIASFFSPPKKYIKSREPYQVGKGMRIRLGVYCPARARSSRGPKCHFCFFRAQMDLFFLSHFFSCARAHAPRGGRGPQCFVFVRRHAIRPRAPGDAPQGPSKRARSHWWNNILRHMEIQLSKPYKTCGLFILLGAFSQKLSRKDKGTIGIFSISWCDFAIIANHEKSLGIHDFASHQKLIKKNL